MKTNKTILLIAAFTLVAALFAVGFSSVFAQGADPSYEDDTPGMGGHGFMMGGFLPDEDAPGIWGIGEDMRDALWQALTDALDLTPEELREELRAGNSLADIAADKDISREDLLTLLNSSLTEALAQAVADGDMTEEQKDDILERMVERFESLVDRSGWGFFFMGEHGFMMGGFLPDEDAPGIWGIGQDMRDALWQTLSDALDLTPEELRKELREGNSLADIAADKDISREDLLTLLNTSLTEALAQAVADGELTEEQKDDILERMSERFESLVDRSGWGFSPMGNFRRPFRPFFNRRGARGMFFNQFNCNCDCTSEP